MPLPALPCQPDVLRPAPPGARFATFTLRPGADARGVLQALAELPFDRRTVLGLGAPLLAAAGVDPEAVGLRCFPDDLGLFPCTQGALWACFGHADPGQAFDAQRAFDARLCSALALADETDAFVYRKGKDLSGFEDGTENPKGKAAAEAALVRGRGVGLDGGSFVAVQKWVHDLAALEAMPPLARDHVIGRARKGNKELADAPPSAHVKRTAQESFEPEAFVVRRSMPWSDARAAGLVFVAFGATLDPFEAQLRRMAGAEDGIADALFGFTRPATGGYYWCPPAPGGRLDLGALGL